MQNQSTLDNDRYRVGHMIEFCEKILRFYNEADQDGEHPSEMRILALLRLFETLGEAASKVSKELKAVHPEIPWLDASDTRNRFIHGYHDLDYSVLWLTIQDDIPQLLEQLYLLRSELEGL